MSCVLVIAPHPDDEVLGVGGAILKHRADGDAVHVVVCTRGEAARFGAAQVETVQCEARAVHAFLGVTGSHFLDFPAARLDTVPGADLNAALAEVFAAVAPDTIYLPHAGDVHRDHQLIFQAGLVCARPAVRSFMETQGVISNLAVGHCVPKRLQALQLAAKSIEKPEIS